ncbi:MAG: cobalamin biosynthesis protein CobQ [Fervidobacterium sp.]|uniref:cobalamin biosynthesis protein CobQ n=1 Tax=Fervidobacterium sp. TaxID=1871331 RepID=UPI00404B83EE
MAKNYAFIGLFGSGKTEVAINWALKLKEEYDKVAIIDGDIISPYFRTRDVAEELEEMGIVPVYPRGALRNADLPIITGAAIGYLSNPEYKTVMDVGGEENGVVVLGYVKPYLGDVEISMVVNIARPFSSTVDGIIRAYEQLRRVARIKVDYLINNANLSYETTPELIAKGEEILSKVSEIIEVPVKFTVIPEFISENGFRYPIFKIKRFMKMEI